MFRLTEKKEGVQAFKFVEENFIELNEEGVFINNQLETKNIDEDNFSLHNGKLIYMNQGVTFFGDITISKTLVANTSLKNFALFSSDINFENLTLKYEFIDLTEGTTILDVGVKPFLKSCFKKDQYVALNYSDHLEIFEIEEGVKKILEYIPEKEKAIENIISISNGKIYLSMDEGSVYSIKIDSSSIDTIWDKINLQENLSIPAEFTFDEEANSIFGVYHTFLREIDLEDSSYKIINLKDELELHKINSFKRSYNNSISDEHIFLTGNTRSAEKINVDLDCLIALNKESKKIDDVYTFLDTGIGTHKPIMIKDHVYQMDIANTLHIFQLESKNIIS